MKNLPEGVKAFILFIYYLIGGIIGFWIATVIPSPFWVPPVIFAAWVMAVIAAEITERLY